MDYIEQDINKLQMMNNYALVEFIDDDVVKNHYITIIKQNYSSKVRSIYVGKIIDRPDCLYLNEDQTIIGSLDNLIKGESIVAYDPRSVQMRFIWENKKYHIIRIEDVYCKLNGYNKEDK